MKPREITTPLAHPLGGLNVAKTPRRRADGRVALLLDYLSDKIGHLDGSRIENARACWSRYKAAKAEEAEAAAEEARANGEAVVAVAKVAQRGFWATVASIELMELSLGVDNVVAAVALSDEMWVVCTGVFIGILALRFVAGHCIKLIEKFPVLEHTAFLLIGFVGLLLFFELTVHHDVKTYEKFTGIVAIIAFTIRYSKSEGVRTVMKPVNAFLMLPVRFYDLVLGGVFWVLLSPFRLFFKNAHLPEPIEEVEHAPLPRRGLRQRVNRRRVVMGILTYTRHGLTAALQQVRDAVGVAIGADVR